MKVGIGQDSHRFDFENKNKKLVLGGVIFENETPLLGNSDADVVLHAITNAVSGVTCVNVLGKKTDEMCKSGITDSEYYVKEGVYQAPLYDGIKDMLETLKDAGCTLMITTSKPETMAVTVAENDEIFEYFSGIIGPALDEQDPNKAILIRRAMAKLSLTERDLKDIIMIGDRFYDIEAACETGIDSIGVLYGYGSEDELKNAGATYIVKEVSDITKIIIR